MSFLFILSLLLLFFKSRNIFSSAFLFNEKIFGYRIIEKESEKSSAI